MEASVNTKILTSHTVLCWYVHADHGHFAPLCTNYLVRDAAYALQYSVTL